MPRRPNPEVSERAHNREVALTTQRGFRRARDGDAAAPGSQTVRLVANVEVTGGTAGCTVLRLRHWSELGEALRLLESAAPFVIDLDLLEPGARQRAFDGLSGLAYAFDATVTRRHDQRFQYLVSPGELRR
jgi:FtsZ-interacting cell division protein YlmF